MTCTRAYMYIYIYTYNVHILSYVAHSSKCNVAAGFWQRQSFFRVRTARSWPPDGAPQELARLWARTTGSHGFITLRYERVTTTPSYHSTCSSTC